MSGSTNTRHDRSTLGVLITCLRVSHGTTGGTQLTHHAGVRLGGGASEDAGIVVLELVACK